MLDTHVHAGGSVIYEHAGSHMQLNSKFHPSSLLSALCRDITLLLTFEASETHGVSVPRQSPWGAADSETNPRVPLNDVARQWAAVEVRLTHIRSKRLRAGGEDGGGGDGGATSPEATERATVARVTVALPAHVKAIQAAAVAAAAATAAAPSAAAAAAAKSAASMHEHSAAPLPTAAAPTASNFLTAAAERSRLAELNRKRTAIAAASQLAQVQRVQLAAASADGDGRGGEALSVAPTTAASKAAAAAAQQLRGSSNAAALRYPVLYKFQEGFTNAVRRPVLLSDFLT